MEVQQVIFPDDIVVDALHFKRKSDTEIIVVVPPGTINGDGVLKIVTLSGTILTTTIISIEVIEIPDETSKVDPITPNTIILLDYEEHGGHNGNWDNGWEEIPRSPKMPKQEIHSCALPEISTTTG